MKKDKRNTKENRTRRIDIRFTESELIQLQQLAENYSLSVSEFVRWSIFQREVTIHFLFDDRQSGLSKIRYQLDRIGNNINQIAKVLNSGFVNPEMFRQELNSMFADIHNEINLLNIFLSEYNSKLTKKASKYSKYYLFDKTIGEA